MPKSSRKKIDEDEKKVIRELQKNSKEGIDEIAKKCGFSRQKVWRIIKRLEKNKTIWGYHAIVDSEKLGKKSFIMLVKRSNKPINGFMDKIIKESKVESMKESGIDVHGTYYLHGNFDWLVVFSAKDIKKAKKFGEIMNTQYSGSISEMYIMENIFPLKDCGMVNPDIEKLREFF